MEIQLEELQKFFNDAHWPQQTERRQTFFSIAGFPHYENVLSNVYNFFFNTNNLHNLGSLFIDSLIDVIKHKGVEVPWTDDIFRKAYSLREVGVEGRQRLDLLIHNGSEETEWQDASAVILIENKVYHWLANDLDNYWNSIDLVESNKQKIGIVLGLRPDKVPSDWIYISHAELAEAIESRLGAALYRAEPRYVTLLLELIENIHTMSNTNKEIGDLLGFFQKNRDYIIKSEKIRTQILEKLPNEISRVLSPEYEVWWNAEAKKDGWLVISKPGKQRCKYILGYYGLFYAEHDSKSFFAIEMHADPDDLLVDSLQSVILSSDHAKSRQIEADNSKYHHVVSKYYQLSSYEYANFPNIIAQKIKDDWFPLETYWSTL